MYKCCSRLIETFPLKVIMEEYTGTKLGQLLKTNSPEHPLTVAIVVIDPKYLCHRKEVADVITTSEHLTVVLHLCRSVFLTVVYSED